MFNTYTILLISASLFANSFATIPDFIKKCNHSDPNINACLKERANDALPHLLDGNEVFIVPKLNPLILSHLEGTSSNVKYAIDNVKIDGWQTAHVMNGSLSFVTKQAAIDFIVKQFTIDGNYDIDGKLLTLPIVGNGPLHIQLDDVELKFIFDLEFIKQENNITYAKVIKTTFDSEIGKSLYKLDNLFNGDDKLGVETNKFLNENPKDVNNELCAPIIEAIKKIIEKVFVHVTDTYSLNVIFD